MYIRLNSYKEIVKSYVLGVAYLFMLTVVGALAVTLYSYFAPVDMMSERSVIIIALIFTVVVALDFWLLFSDKPTPTLIAILVIISPILELYRLLKNTDLIRIDQSTPKKLKNYVPPRFIGW